MKYKAYQYTDTKRGLRIVVESKTPILPSEAWKMVLDSLDSRTIDWEPIEDTDSMTMPPMMIVCVGCGTFFNGSIREGNFCSTCSSHDHDDECVGSCPIDPAFTENDLDKLFPCDNGCETRYVKREGDCCLPCTDEIEYMVKMDAVHDNERFGGDPQDPATWHGNEPDQTTWADIGRNEE